MIPQANVYAVIMAGGGGTRFWPWSRQRKPKQLLPIISRRTMIRETADRLRSFVPWERILIVTSRSQAALLRREIPLIPGKNILLEPAGRNTAPCLCLSAVPILKRDPDAVMVALPADHAIADRKEFLRTLRTGCRFAAREDFLLTLGMRPTAPETGYGYIQRGSPLVHLKGTKIFKARAFREKPTLDKARNYLRRGDYLWNSGIFIWKAGVFREAVRKFLPQLHREMSALDRAWDTPRERKVLEGVYEKCRPVSVDYGIMEKAKNVAVLEASFGWDDVGSWSALWSLRPKDEAGNAHISAQPGRKGRVLAINSSGCLIRGEEKLIAVLGMKDTIVVEAGDALLVCSRHQSQEVRRILKELQKKGWHRYL